MLTAFVFRQSSMQPPLKLPFGIVCYSDAPRKKTLSFIWLLVIEFFIFDVASWHLNSGPHQESHKIRIMHVPTLLSLAHKRGSQIVAHKTWPTNLSTKRDKTKLWKNYDVGSWVSILAAFLLPRPEKAVLWPTPCRSHLVRVAVVALMLTGLVEISSNAVLEGYVKAPVILLYLFDTDNRIFRLNA